MRQTWHLQRIKHGAVAANEHQQVAALQVNAGCELAGVPAAPRLDGRHLESRSGQHRRHMPLVDVLCPARPRPHIVPHRRKSMHVLQCHARLAHANTLDTCVVIKSTQCSLLKACHRNEPLGRDWLSTPAT